MAANTGARKQKDLQLKEVPKTIKHAAVGMEFTRGRFLGKGGFARCYELTTNATNMPVAGKVVSKTLLVKPYQKEKMAQEIKIHQQLKHNHVVKLYDYFDDDDNVYVILELCARRSLMELQKRRKVITEPEARYFMLQLVDGVEYLHRMNIVHRDLKLGNLFISDGMSLKIGDFGLAAQLNFGDDKKQTVCGTPNYIAPEVLDKRGHSYEVDIWAIGCILYTLIVGNPPFQTDNVKEMYERIKTNRYRFPCWMGDNLRNVIRELLAADPIQRPTICMVTTFDFFKQGYTPQQLPISCLTMAPKFPADKCPSVSRCVCCTHPLTGRIEENESPADFHLGELYAQLVSLISHCSIDRAINCEDVAEAPEAMPVFWVSKWVDYSDKYGIGYQLCDNSVGVLFNDASKMIMDSRGNQLFYIQRNNSELYYYGFECPAELEKKFTLLKYFRKYMNENLLKAGEHVAPKIGDELARLPHVRAFFRTSSAIVFHLSNGTLQINFFKDHTKLIVCPLMGAVTYLNSEKIFRVFKFSLIEKFGCSKDLLTLLRYAKTMVERLLSNSTSRMAASSDKLSRDGRVG